MWVWLRVSRRGGAHRGPGDGRAPLERFLRARALCDPEAGALSHVWLSSSLMALATLLSVGTAVFFCRRYSVLKTLFPPIPHLKDPFGGSLLNEKMFPWEAGRTTLEECPVAELQVLRET